MTAGHGTPARYRTRCRCAECRAANTARHMMLRAARRTRLAAVVVEHGSESTYVNWACRCRLCLAAHRTEMAEQYAARKALLARDPDVAEHGRRNTYNAWGCRCEPCRLASWADHCRRPCMQTAELTRQRQILQRLAAGEGEFADQAEDA